jgi:acetoin utilization deacetylase AcuC-like enzyme
MRVYYSPDYVLSGYAFDTTRKAGWVADSLRERPIPGVALATLATPAPLTEEQICAVHDPAYVAAVRTGDPRALATSQGFEWDPQLWPMVLASNGGAVAAALTALREGVAGSLSSGLHHAHRDRGAGFCTFNGLVLAARAALDAGARSLLILDLDAHCGGGTHSLVADDPRIRQLDLAVSAFDLYQPAGHNTLDLLGAPDRYLPTLEARLRALDAGDQTFDLCLYNAGMDPHKGCEIGGLAGMTRELLARREQVVFAWLRARRVPVAFVLAGGYVGPRLARPELVDLHRLTLEAAVGAMG